MSAWIASKEHIDIIVDAFGEKDQKEQNKIGQTLWNETYKSVNYRYDEEKVAPKYVFEKPRTRYSTLDAIKLCHSLEYQSCETKDYNKSKAYKLLRSIVWDIVSQLDGYSDAKWSVRS